MTANLFASETGALADLDLAQPKRERGTLGLRRHRRVGD